MLRLPIVFYWTIYSVGYKKAWSGILTATLSEIGFAIKLFNTYQPVIGKVSKVHYVVNGGTWLADSS